ncbi:unnamed protein product [Blepharisma stoltei]|uniref:F-box domain-containing protein n=1 Tax=Blepharisma stoltei TaxID=1481888 RepID=A0AAU9K9K1_9CILI|nr:unnamed protein product [Blepharisma stoltei]
MEISCVIPSIGLFLSSKDTFLSLSLVCKEWHQLLSDNYVLFWLKSTLKTSSLISLEDAKLQFPGFANPEILNFQPWFSEGGISPKETGNCFRNIWTYDGLTYSTYYGSRTNSYFKKNIICSAFYEGGGYQSHFFFDYGHRDIFLAENYYFPEKYLDYNKYNIQELLTLAPLFPEENILDLQEYDPIPDPWNPIFDHDGCEWERISYPYYPCQAEIAFVNEIAVARPLYFTSAIKTMVIFFSAKVEEEMDTKLLDIADDILTIEDAKRLGPIAAEVDLKREKYVEFQKVDKEWYPVIWIQFQSWKLNHFEIPLQSIHQVARVAIKMINTDDLREEFFHPDGDLNFDILYCLFLGRSIKLVENLNN